MNTFLLTSGGLYILRLETTNNKLHYNPFHRSQGIPNIVNETGPFQQGRFF